MKKFCKFSDIGQFREIYATIKHRAQYIGKDENGECIYDTTIPLPTVKVLGTVKIDGSNGGITMNKEGEIWAQSHDRILTLEEDNYNFAFILESKKEIFKELLNKIDFNGYDYITIFGEVAGKGIQKGMAVCQLPRMFVIFDIKRSYDDNSKGDNKYASIDEIKTLRSPENNIYNIYDFTTFEVEIDFNEPQEAMDRLTDITTNVGVKCPFGEAMGVEGRGEGEVFVFYDEDGNKYRFKVKAEKSKISKTKELVTIDVERVNSIREFVEYSVTENRLNQGLEQTFGCNGILDITRMGCFLQWLAGDIIKEEMDVLIKNNLEPKAVTGAISKKGRDWLLNKINNFE